MTVCRGVTDLPISPNKSSHMQVMGLQHALAMVGGIVTPPLIISYLQKDAGIANCES